MVLVCSLCLTLEEKYQFGTNFKLSLFPFILLFAKYMVRKGGQGEGRNMPVGVFERKKEKDD